MEHIPGNESVSSMTCPTRSGSGVCEQRQATVCLCRRLRPVLEDAGNYIRFITQKLESDSTQEFYREARMVVLSNISEALDRIDELLTAGTNRINVSS